MIKEQKKSLLRRRKIYTLIAALLVIVLIPTLITITYLSKNKNFEDPADSAIYKIKYKDGVYAMYDKDGTPLEFDEALRAQVSAGEMFRFYVTSSGTIVKVNIEDGSYEVYAVVDTVDGEALGFDSRILIFPRIQKANIRSIEVENSEGSFTFYRYNFELERIDDTAEFTIKGAPYATFDEEAFAALYISAGYTISTQKIQDPIKDPATGEYTEYGLAKEIRVNDEGEEYEYSPAYITLTDTSGKKHRLIVGDQLPTGSGYYVQYVSIDGDVETKRDAVYVLDNDVGSTALSTKEMFVNPMINYPLSINDYQHLENFKIYNTTTGKNDVAFSYIKPADRSKIYTHITYRFDLGIFDGYIPNSENISDALLYFCEMDFVGVKKLSPSNQDFVDYNLGKITEGEDGKKNFEHISKYQIFFDYDVTDSDGKYERTLTHHIYISEKTEDGNYYAYSYVFDKKTEEPIYSPDMIVEIKGHCFNFLEWRSSEWIEDRYVYLNIAHCEKIKFETGDYWAEFDIYNPDVDAEKVTSANIRISGVSSLGDNVKTFSAMTFDDKFGYTWTVTQTGLTAQDAYGQNAAIPSAYYATNAIGKQTRVVPEAILCDNGIKVEVSANEVVITYADGSKTTYVRYATDLFRRLYQTLTVSTLESSYELTAEEEAALIADPSKHILTITIKDVEGNETVYSFYSLTSQKTYITVNGSGGFYVLPSRVNKFISDTQKFFRFEPIDPDAKN